MIFFSVPFFPTDFIFYSLTNKCIQSCNLTNDCTILHLHVATMHWQIGILELKIVCATLHRVDVINFCYSKQYVNAWVRLTYLIGKTWSKHFHFHHPHAHPHIKCKNLIVQFENTPIYVERKMPPPPMTTNRLIFFSVVFVHFFVVILLPLASLVINCAVKSFGKI